MAPVFQHLLGRTKQIIVTLRFSLLSVFAMLFIITMLLLLSIFYFHLAEIVLHAASLLMDKTAYTILDELDSELKPIETASQFSANNIREKVLDVNNVPEISGYMVHLLKRLPLAESVYWGDQNGNFVYVDKEPGNTFTAELISTNTQPATHVKIYYDSVHRELKRTVDTINYDPRTRIWYKLAIQKKRAVWTDLYPYEQSEHHYVGITVATPAFDATTGAPIGVFGVDVTLNYLSQFLAQQKIGTFGEIFILDRNGQIIVSQSGVDKNNKLNNDIIARPWVAKAFEVYKDSAEHVFQLKFNNQLYLATFRPISLLSDNGWLIAVVDVASDFTNKIHTIEFFYVGIVVVVFIIGLMIMSHLITRIVTPIKKLVKETEKIKNFELEGQSKITSRIKEVIELSDAIYSMKRGLRSFKRYVPAGLVRQLIRSGEDAQVGGSKRELAILFTDIQNFTTIAERSDYNQLVHELNDYFETFSQVIVYHEGTIDKFIGDAIMAFWGAPVPIEKPCHLAAYTALVCLARLKNLIEQWQIEGLPIFLTRFGIHYGDAIVGSIGSSERLNYTAIGDSVNIASRLVAANKIYNTFILVTATVYQQIKDDFILRFVDKVIFKGKVESIAIYELLGEHKHKILFDIDLYREKFAAGFKAYEVQNWQEAIANFIVCMELYPQDKLAPIFIERCKYFALNPPLEWNGVWHISEK